MAWPDLACHVTDPARLLSELAQHLPDLAQLKITLILVDIAQYRPILGEYWRILGYIA